MAVGGRPAPPGNPIKNMTDPEIKSAPRQFITQKTVMYIGLVIFSAAIGVASVFVEPLYLIAGIIAVPMAILVYKYIYFGLVIYLLLFLVRPGEMYPALAPLRMEFLLGAMLIVVVLLKNKWKYGSLRIPADRLNIDFLMVIAALGLSGIASACTDCTIGVFTAMIKLGIFYLLIILVVDTRKRLEIFFWIFLIANVYLALDIIKHFMAGSYTDTGGLARASGGNSAVDNMNGIAITMNTIIPFIYYLLLHYKDFLKRALMFVMLAVAVLTLVLTGSRGGLLGFMTIVGIIWWRSPRKIASAMVISIVLVAGWFSMEETRRERYLTIFSSAEDRDESAQGRIDAWIDGMHLFVDRPLVGNGAGAFAWARAFRFGTYLQPHNMYVQIIAELGIVGALVYFFFLRDIFRTNRKILRHIRSRGSPNALLAPLALGTTASCASLLVTGVFAHSTYRFSWYLFAALTVVAHHLLKIEMAEQGETEEAAVIEQPAAETGGAPA